MGSKCSSLSLTPACRTQSGATQHQCCAIFEMWEGEWFWVQLSFAAWALLLVPEHSGEWRRDPAVVIFRDLSRDNHLPASASSCCLEEQHTKTMDKQRLLSCTGILVPQGPSHLFFHDFLTFLFFCLFLFFRGSWRKWNEAVEFPECSPSSWLCAVRGHVTLWSWADTLLSSGFENQGPARTRGSPAFDQPHSTTGDVSSQRQGLHILVRGYL